MTSTTRIRYPDMVALLETIRVKPGLFLGEPSLLGLNLFLSGIRHAEDFHNLPANMRLQGFDAQVFERWVAPRYNPEDLSLNSFSLAVRIAGSEEKGFDLWFDWYDEFKAANSNA